MAKLMGETVFFPFASADPPMSSLKNFNIKKLLDAVPPERIDHVYGHKLNLFINNARFYCGILPFPFFFP